MKTINKIKNPLLCTLIVEDIIEVILILEKDILKYSELMPAQIEKVQLVVDKMISDLYQTNSISINNAKKVALN